MAVMAALGIKLQHEPADADDLQDHHTQK